jgi:hypothetical protein
MSMLMLGISLGRESSLLRGASGDSGLLRAIGGGRLEGDHRWMPVVDDLIRARQQGQLQCWWCRKQVL